MKNKRKKQVKVPAHMFGMFAQIGQMVEGLGEGLKQSGAGDLGQAIAGAANPAKAGLQYLGNKDVSVGNKLLAFTGIGSIFARKQAERARKRREATTKETAMGLGNAANTEQEYWDDNSLAYTYANGGVIPNNLAYLDNNEVIRDVYGNIDQVPDNKPGTDNHLVDASDLESVLSDKLKRPGTNRTFAQEGEKLTKMTKSSKGKDIFAENTNELNRRNANRKYNELLAEQETVKQKKGIKSKSKTLPQYKNGLDGTDYPTIWNTPYDIPFGRTSTTPQYNGLNNLTPAGRLPWLPYGSTDTTTDIPTVTSATSKGKGTGTKRSSTIPTFNKVDTPEIFVPEDTPEIDLSGETDPELSPVAYSDNPASTKSGGFGIKGLEGLSSLLDLAPSMFNLFQGRKSEVDENVINPYAGAVTNAMAKRRMNINPAREANRRSRAIANYNAANMNANTGANLAFRTQAATSEYANNADMYATKQNADNAYLGEYANMMNNLGQQFVQGQRLTNDNNARNRAMSRNFTGTGLSQFSQWNQVRRQERNQANRDEMIYPFLKNFLQYGNAQELIDAMDKQYYGKGKK